jgi:cellulose biosynthesis protein BcsQ
MDLALDDSNKPTRRLGRVLEPVAEHYDLAVLDCPPSISLVSESVFEAADTLLVPLIPSTLTMRTFDQLDGFVAERVSHPPDIVAFFSMVDRRKRLHRQVVESFPTDRSDVARTAIPAATEVELMGVRRTPVVVDRPHSRAGRAYQGLWVEVRGRLGL